MAFANNYQSARQLFTNRKRYKEAYGPHIPEYIDFNDKRYFYGRVDEDFNPIILRGDKLKSVSQEGPAAWAADFVVDAFEDMKEYFAEALALTQGDKYTNSIIDGMIVQRGWVSANSLYEQHMVNTQRIYAVTYLRQALRDFPIRDATDYVDTFMRYYEDLGTPYPLTRSNFTLSGYVSPNSSGLCLEIDSAEHASDQYKVQEYYDNPVFGEYVKIARRFGFLIDKNAPWRLVANLASPIMLKYMKRYNVATRKQLFATYYEEARSYDIESLKRYFINGYNDYVSDSPTSTYMGVVECAAGPKVVTREVTRKPVFYMPSLDEDHTLQSQQKVVKDSFWLDKYYVLRHREGDFAETEAQTEAGIRRVTTIEKTLDIGSAVEYITNKTKTTYRKYTLAPPKERAISDVVTCCVPPAPNTTPETPSESDWRLGPVQGGMTPNIVPAGTQGTPPRGGTD